MHNKNIIDTAYNNFLKAITLKRQGQIIPCAIIIQLVQDFIDGKLADHQMSAWLATVASLGMDIEEVVALTQAYVLSGSRITHPKNLKLLDKHSTGGVGDKITLISIPIVVACGVPVVKISGRGLGHAGGTLDKLESINNLKLHLTPNELTNILKINNMVIAGQSDDIVPGDQQTYKLRDISGAVESIPLIAASIISKKIATGCKCLVLNVTTGLGALIPDQNLSLELAQTMVALAKRFGIAVRAIISDMNQPLGCAVGNALEIKEALQVLQGSHIPRLTILALEIAKLMLQTHDPTLSEKDAKHKISTVIADGSAYQQFLKWVDTQGGDIQQIINPSKLSTTQYKKTLTAPIAGWIKKIDPRLVGECTLKLGAYRQDGGRVYDHAVGVILKKKVSDAVEIGDPILEIHYNDNSTIAEAEKIALASIEISSNLVEAPPIIYRVIE